MIIRYNITWYVHICVTIHKGSHLCFYTFWIYLLLIKTFNQTSQIILNVIFNNARHCLTLLAGINVSLMSALMNEWFCVPWKAYKKFVTWKDYKVGVVQSMASNQFIHSKYFSVWFWKLNPLMVCYLKLNKTFAGQKHALLPSSAIHLRFRR